MENLLVWDKELFLWLNSLGNQTFDWFWMMMTHRLSNLIVYLTLLIFIWYKNSWRTSVYIFLFASFLILCTDQLTNLFKVQVGRLRPCHDNDIKSLIRLVKLNCGGKFSFFSGHASNSFALAVFFGYIIKVYIKNILYFLLFIASLIAYSRVYIGVHFPLDIFCGAIVGIINGYIFYKIWVNLYPSKIV